MVLGHSEFIESFSSSHHEDSSEFKYFYGLVTNSLLFHLLGRLCQGTEPASFPKLIINPIKINSLRMAGFLKRGPVDLGGQNTLGCVCLSYES